MKDLQNLILANGGGAHGYPDTSRLSTGRVIPPMPSRMAPARPQPPVVVATPVLPVVPQAPAAHVEEAGYTHAIEWQPKELLALLKTTAGDFWLRLPAQRESTLRALDSRPINLNLFKPDQLFNLMTLLRQFDGPGESALVERFSGSLNSYDLNLFKPAEIFNLLTLLHQYDGPGESALVEFFTGALNSYGKFDADLDMSDMLNALLNVLRTPLLKVEAFTDKLVAKMKLTEMHIRHEDVMLIAGELRHIPADAATSAREFMRTGAQHQALIKLVGGALTRGVVDKRSAVEVSRQIDIARAMRTAVMNMDALVPIAWKDADEASLREDLKVAAKGNNLSWDSFRRVCNGKLVVVTKGDLEVNNGKPKYSLVDDNNSIFVALTRLDAADTLGAHVVADVKLVKSLADHAKHI